MLRLPVVVQLMELHQQAADLLLQDAAGCTLLHHAVEAGNKEILKYLIDNGETHTRCPLLAGFGYYLLQLLFIKISSKTS